MEIFTKLCSAKLSFENFSKNSGFSAWDRILLNKEIIISRITFFTEVVTAWKVSKYGPEKATCLDTFHAVCNSVLIWK